MAKHGLGKGLDALLASVQADEGERVVHELPVESVAPNPLQPRQHFDEKGLQELADSIRANGVLQPVLVRRHGPDGYQLIAGERRLRAAKMAGLRTIPAIIRECSDRDLVLFALVENLQRQDVNPVEQARAYQRMQQEFGLTQEEIARRVGRSRPAVANTLRLLQLPGPVLQAVEQGRLSEGHARLLVSLEPPLAIEAMDTFLAQDMSVREAERLVRDLRRGVHPDQRSQSAEVERDPNLVALESALSVNLGTRVTVVPLDMDRGRIIIEYYSAEQLEGLVERLTGGG